ncbi:putative uncharacterized protein DDB_G0271982 isoform X2 [Rhopalosiphum padi]|uniref:putative uncharacterized protein DDB_G0271982 isoform X2 n=1 Tax=Rhopalosiphum padi TaxID=40932 RepID=UPI00298E9B88|nr:putative uncharacterized protein DDB_G0271982 isoform X2 [Rhopalosiphum padi]XP_060836054.1 putative uncharacterized protein DDB_G0271982 isoform X2 [Rhopalosiphum padi]
MNSLLFKKRLSLYINGGKTYLNNEFEIIYGGSPKVMTKIDGADFAGVKRVRRLTSKEILELKERRNKQKEIEKKQEEEEKRREQKEKEREKRQEKKEREKERKQEEKEKERERKQEEKERQRERKQEEKERQRERKQDEEERRRERKMGEARGIKGTRRDTKKSQHIRKASQYEVEILKSNIDQQIRRTLSNKQNTQLGRSPRRKNV